VSPRAGLGDAAFAAAWTLLRPLRERRRRELLASAAAPRRILVLTPVFGVGNLVLLTGLLANVRRLYPDAHVTLAVPAWPHVPSVIGPDLADEIVPFDPRSRRGALAVAWRELRPRRFDLGLATFFLDGPYASVLLAVAGCRHRVAFAADDRRGFLNTVTCVDRGGHEMDRHLQLLAFTGRDLERSARLAPTEEDRRWASATLRRVGLDDVPRLVGVHPGCERVNAQKRWPAARFGEVVRILVEDDDASVLVFLGPGEEDVRPALRLPDSPRVHVVTAESLAHVIALVARCDAFVSNDSGLMHVAAALGIPVAAIFGPTPVEKNRPVGRATILEQPGIWCRPCWAGPPLTCHRDRPYCLEGVRVEAVVDAIRALLGRPAAGAVQPRAS
jgi:ADP-heptose:LPS heptosyltransferase